MLSKYYYLPAVVSVSIYLCFFIYVSLSKKKNNGLFYILILCVTAMNSVELIFYSNTQINLTILKLYYIFGLIGLTITTTLVNQIVNLNYHLINQINYISVSIVIVLLLSTEYIIVDYIPLGNSYTRIPGQFYFIFQFFVFSNVSINLFFIISTVFSKNKANIVRARASILLFSFVPVLFTILHLIYNMAIGMKINFNFYFPIMSIFILFGIYTSSKNPYDFSKFIPKTPSNQEIKNLLYFFRANTNYKTFFDQMLLIEKDTLQKAYIETKGDGQLSKLARRFDSSTGKIDYKLKKHGFKKSKNE